MSVPCVQLQRFVTALHRRYTLWRLLERTGLGLLGGSLAGLALVPLALWAGKPTLALVLGALCFGTSLGLLWGILRRPTRLGSAMQADRQLDLQDLLGTALSIDSSDNGLWGPWAGAVLATADARCAQLKPASVVLSRISTRAWGGIALSAAAAMVLAMFFGAPADSRAAANRSPELNAAPSLDPSTDDPSDRPLIAMAPAAPSAAAEHDDPDNRSLGQSSATSPGDRKPPGQAADSSRANNSATPGIGGGSSQTNEHQSASTPAHSPDTPRDPVRERPASNVASKATGASGEESHPDGSKPRGTSTGGVINAAHGSDAHLTPPWKTDAWPADVQRAHAAIDSGQVPPAYQEMVRRYFDR